MKFRLLTLFSIIVALLVKTYAMNSRDGIIDDEEVELLANWELKNSNDSIQHEAHVQRIVKTLAASDRVTEEYTGAASLVKCNAYYEYSRLKRAANEYELNTLLDHESAVVRIYAHRAIMEKNYTPDPYSLAQIANDSTEVTWLNGDVLVHTTVMDLVSTNMFHTMDKESLMAEMLLNP